MADDLTKVAEDSTRGSFFLISGTALATVIMAISSILVGSLLGPDLYGQYTLALVVPQVLVLFTDLGISQGITKFTADLNAKGEVSRLKRIVKYAILLRSIAGFLIFIINYALADFFASVLFQRPYLSFYIKIASTSILFQVISGTATSAFVGLDKTEYNALTTSVHALAKTVISVALVLLGFGVAGAILGITASQVIGAAIGAIILFLVLRTKHQTCSGDITEDLKALVRYGAPLYIAILLMGFIPLYQSIMLATFTNNTDIGNYKAATNFISLLTVVSVPVTTALLPAFAKLDSSASQRVNTFFQLANKYISMLILPITLLMIAYSTEIIQIVYFSSDYQTAPLFLAIYCLAYFLVGLGYLTLTSFFNGMGETKTTLMMQLIVFIAVIILSPILTQSFGVLGLIATSLTATALFTTYGLYKAKQIFHVRLDTHSLTRIYPIAIISIIPSVLLLNSGFIPAVIKTTTPSYVLSRLGFLPQLIDFAVGAILYILLYLTLAPLTKTVTKPELNMITRVTQRTKLLAFIAKPILKYEQKIMQLTSKPSEPTHHE